MDDGDYQDPSLWSGVNSNMTLDERDAAYIAAGATPFERLARKWERQSSRTAQHPNQTTPKEIGEERFCEFWDVWEKAERK